MFASPGPCGPAHSSAQCSIVCHLHEPCRHGGSISWRSEVPAFAVGDLIDGTTHCRCNHWETCRHGFEGSIGASSGFGYHRKEMKLRMERSYVRHITEPLNGEVSGLFTKRCRIVSVIAFFAARYSEDRSPACYDQQPDGVVRRYR